MRDEIVKQFHRQSPLSSHIELFGYLDDKTSIATYCGDCVVVLESSGADCECLEDAEIEMISRRQERARRALGPEYRLYEYLFREKGEKFNRTELNAAVVKMARKQKTGIFSSLKKYKRDLEVEIGRNQSEALRAARALVDQSGCGYRILSEYESFRVLRRIVNLERDSRKAPACPEFLNCQLADSDIEVCHREKSNIDDHMRVGKWFVRVLTMSELSYTQPLLLYKLQEVDGNIMAVAEWNAIDQGKTVIDRMRGLTNSFKSQASMSLSSKKDGKGLEDQGDVLDVEELGDAQKRLRKGEAVGNYSLTVVVYGETYKGMEETQAEVERVASAVDIKLRAEKKNQLAALMATVPGGYGYQFRKLKIMDQNAAQMGFWFAPEKGEEVNRHLDAPSLLSLRTTQGTKYDLNLHLNDVGHSFVLGDTGSGKSFAVNAILCAMLEKYKPYMVIFDKGKSFRWTTLAHHGAYLEMSPEEGGSSCTINPFACEPTERNLRFLKLLARVLMEQNGPRLSADELDKLHKRVDNVFICPPKERRIGLLAELLGSLGGRLKRWVGQGEYAWVFDHEKDSLDIGRVQCFEFQGTDAKNQNCREVLEPLILTIIHRATEPLYDESRVGSLKVFSFGELWQFLQNPSIEAFVADLLRTGRKNNGMVLMETQSPLELMESRIAPVILGACSTRLYLSSRIDKKYAEVLELSEKKLEIISSLRPKGQILFDQPKSRKAKILNLEVDERTKWLAANDPESNLRRNEAIEKWGEGVDQWLPGLLGYKSNGGTKNESLFV